VWDTAPLGFAVAGADECVRPYTTQGTSGCVGQPPLSSAIGKLQATGLKLSWLLQLRVFGTGFLENGNIRIRIFPEFQKLAVLGQALVLIAGERIGAGQSEVS